MESNRLILSYRWCVFLLATFFVGYAGVFGTWDVFGGPLRYLTIWGLLLSWVVSVMVLRISLGATVNRWDALVSATAVVNAMVVFLYWRLYFADPNSVTADGELDVWWREYYLHAAGPVLMWIDALFFNKVFQRFAKGAVVLVTIVGAYVAWSELILRPINTTPEGSVTSGLSYPFLNDLAFADRAIFYGVNITVALIFLAGFCLLAWAIRRIKNR